MKDLGIKAFTGCALIALSPILLTISLLVKATSRGPVLFNAEMLGRNARVFRMIKFRTMRVGAKQILNRDDKTVIAKNDPRLTFIAPLLRIGFDELPQLINILASDMSIVGPRPDPSWVLPRYTSQIRRRLDVNPGITGLSQVLDGRSQRQAVIYYLDCYYVDHRSLGMDLKILALTIPYLIGFKTPGQRILNRIMQEAGDRIALYELLPPGDHPQPGYIS